MGNRRSLKGPVKWAFIFLTGLALAVSVVNLFHLTPFGFVMIDLAYWAVVLGIFLPFSFLIYPLRGLSPRDRIPWYDYVLAALGVLGPLYVIIYAEPLLIEAWATDPSTTAFILGIVMWVLLLEATRRITGIPLLIIVGLASAYPLVANYMPDILVGKAYPLHRIVGFHFMSSSGIFGLPIQVFCRLIVGFMLFGVALQVTGGGKFFFTVSEGLLGHVRGGPAKVSILASSLFATMSGSTISNVITTGSMTIPIMIKSGYPRHFAAAVESCASTGGLLMPPVMGITAFIMADFLRIPYYQICLAAALPIILYYIGLFLQLDFYAAKAGLGRLPKSESLSVLKSLRHGWIYFGALLVLMYFLFFEQVESWAPYYGTVFLLCSAFLTRETRPTLGTFVELLESTGNALVNLTPLLGAVGMLLGALSLTGVAHSFAGELTDLAGGSLALLLGLAALGSVVMGMGMPAVSCYIFLAMLVGPALINAGLDPVASHLFFLYWGMLSFITPPVCLSVYAACGIAGSGVVRTGIQAVRLGMVGFLIPFFFILNPALIGKGSFLGVLYAFFSALVGVVLLSAGLEGYFFGLGRIGWVTRLLWLAGGVLLMFSGWKTDMTGLAVLIAGSLPLLFRKIHQK
ncbi:MAG: TRAP transporter fused permease subunit [Pseudomonadota bacterium]